MNLAKCSSKLILCILTILFWGVAAGLSYIGTTIFMSYEREGQLITYLHSIMPGLIILGVAFVMFLIGIIGVCGLFSENRCLLGIFFTVMTTLLGLEIAGVVLLFIYRERVDNFAKEVFDEVLKKYGAPNETKLTQNFDFVQHQLKCCGQLNYTDWQYTWWYENVKDHYGKIPQSCCVNYEMTSDNFNLLKISKRERSNSSNADHYCKGEAERPNQSDNYYQDGCYSKLKQIVRGRFIYIAAVILALIFIQLIGLVSTCILMCCRRKNIEQPPYINIATHEDAHYNL